MDSSTKNALFVVGVIVAAIVVTFISLLITSMIIESKKSSADIPVKINFYLEEDSDEVFTFDTKIGQTLVIPSAEDCDFENDGYSFDGWSFKSSDQIFECNAGDEISPNTTIDFYAKWKESSSGENEEPEVEKVVVTFHYQNDFAYVQKVEVEKDKTITLPSVGKYTKTGYTFKYWEDNRHVLKSAGEEIEINSATSFYAVWAKKSSTTPDDPNPGNPDDPTNPDNPTPETFTVEFIEDDPKGSVFIIATYQIEENAKFVLPTLSSLNYTPYRQGWTFKCWAQNALVVYDSEGGHWAVVREGFEEDDEIDRDPGDEITVTSDITFFLVWEEYFETQAPQEPEEPEEPEYLVVLLYEAVIDYGSLNDNLLEAFEIEIGSTFTLPYLNELNSEKLHFKNYTIKFWAQNGFTFGNTHTAYYENEIDRQPGDTIVISGNKEIEFWIVWEEYYETQTPQEPETETYTITFYKDENDYENDLNPTSFTIESGSTYTLPTPQTLGYSKEDYEFYSWVGHYYNEEIGEYRDTRDYLPGESIEIDSNLIFYANWVVPNEFVDSYGVLYRKIEEGLLLVDASNLTTPGHYSIPSTFGDYEVIKIGDNAFKNCTSLTSITIPSSVTSIGDGAFQDCINLTSVAFPSIPYISRRMFSGCTSLSTIIIPNSTRYIDAYAFENCTNLHSVFLASSLVGISEFAFGGCISLTYIEIPASVEGLPRESPFDGCTNLTLKFLGRTGGVYPRGVKSILVKENDLEWYCNQWYLSTEKYYYETEIDPNTGNEIQVQHEYENWYGNYNISTYQ